MEFSLHLRWGTATFAIMAMVFVRPVLADDYPHRRIEAQLEAAQETVEIDLSQMAPGQRLIVEYVGRPVFIYRRTKADLDELTDNVVTRADPTGETHRASLVKAYGSSDSQVWAQLLLATSPDIAHRPYRSLKKEYLVVGGWGPASGCHLRLARDEDKKEPTRFIDACAGVSYDVAGHALVHSGRPDSEAGRYSLYIPPHSFKASSHLTLGVPAEDLPLPDPPDDPDRYKGLNPTQRLIVAARYNDAAAARAAIEAGADANFYRQGVGSPIDAAIIGSSMELLRLIVEAGGRPTPNSLYVAEIVGREEAIELIRTLSAGDTPNMSLEPTG